jgi:hypothetical protein
MSKLYKNKNCKEEIIIYDNYDQKMCLYDDIACYHSLEGKPFYDVLCNDTISFEQYNKDDHEKEYLLGKLQTFKSYYELGNINTGLDNGFGIFWINKDTNKITITNSYDEILCGIDVFNNIDDLIYTWNSYVKIQEEEKNIGNRFGFNFVDFAIDMGYCYDINSDSLKDMDEYNFDLWNTIKPDKYEIIELCEIHELYDCYDLCELCELLNITPPQS